MPIKSKPLGKLLTTCDGDLAAAMQAETWLVWANLAGRELRAQRERVGELESAIRAIYKGLSSEHDGEFWTAQKWCDQRDIYVDNLQGLRVLEEIARVVQRTSPKGEP